MKEEVLDIVNEKDEIIGNAPYEEIHQKKLRHRVAHALIFNDAGEFLLQLRAAHKKAFPMHWSFSIGGHVRHGESYEKALVREAQEEANLSLLPENFICKGKGTYTDELGHKVAYKTYELHYDGPIEAGQKEEVAALQFTDIATFKNMLTDAKEKFQPEMLAVLKRHWGSELGL